MANFPATISVDTTGAATQWQTTKQSLAALRLSVDAVQAAFGTLGVVPTVTNNRVDFAVNSTQLLSALGDLHSLLVTALGNVETAQQNANSLPVTVALT